MGSCWALTTGEYSDYRVRAVFESEKDARAAEASSPSRGYGDEVSVEEFPFFPEGSKQPEVVTEFYRSVKFSRDREEMPWTVESEYGDSESKLDVLFYDHPPARRPEVTLHMPNKHFARFGVRGSDRKAVDKVFSDRRARFLAVGHLEEQG